MNTEMMKEMAGRAKNKVTEFAYEHREDIAILVRLSVTAFLAMVYGYKLGQVRTMATVLGNEQRIRYAEAAATPNIEVHTDIPKK